MAATRRDGAAPDLIRAATRAATRDFRPEDLRALPEPVRRYLASAILPGTPLAAGARLQMRGQIKLKRWLPFHATQVLAPHVGTVWSARVGGVIVGSDRYVGGSGGMRWRLFGLLPVMQASGPDVTRSSAERAAGESVWVPTALVPDAGVEWTADDESHITATFNVDRYRVALHLEIDHVGHVRSSVFDRWGDPDNTGTWRAHPFGLVVTRNETMAGVHIPVAGRVGWHFGTDRWPAGEFFHYEITRYEPLHEPGR